MSSVPRWYYYLDHDPRGVLTPGWYAYEDALNTAVETLYQQSPQWTTTNNHTAVIRPWIPVPMASHSSGFAYQIQFGPHMHVQRNQRTGKQRPIARTTNGMPPHTTTTTSSGTAATAPLAPTVLSVSNHPPAIIPSFGATSTSITNASPVIAARAWRIGSVLHYRAPSSLAQHHHLHDETAVFEDITNNHKSSKHATNGSNHDDEDECAICMDELWDTGNHHHHHSNNHPSQPSSSKCVNPSKHQTNKVVALKMCHHAFHYDCIKESLTKLGLKCPKCRVSVVDHTTRNSHHHHHHPSIQGKCPSGTLTTTLNPTLHCQGFPHHLGTWQLLYSIPNGIQADFHPSPGLGYTGFSSRVAYVPDTREGQALVARLHYAFGHGVMFVVGTSMTTGQSNVVTWASIHVKTNPTGGVIRHGFPDRDYFTRAHQELDDAGVPHNSQACQQWYDQLLPLTAG